MASFDKEGLSPIAKEQINLEWLLKPAPKVHSPEELRDYFNNGGVDYIAEPLDYLIAEDLAADGRFVLKEEERQFSAFWHELDDRRLLVVQSNLARLAGLSLSLTVELEEYRLSHGDICASYSPRLETGHRVGHYLKKGGGPAIGDPNVVIAVQRLAALELVKAAYGADNE